MPPLLSSPSIKKTGARANGSPEQERQTIDRTSWREKEGSNDRPRMRKEVDSSQVLERRKRKVAARSEWFFWVWAKPRGRVRPLPLGSAERD
ncbi:hypothetical protein RHS03_09564, partial [Rhizoctonia solani]